MNEIRCQSKCFDCNRKCVRVTFRATLLRHDHLTVHTNGCKYATEHANGEGFTA